MNAITKPQQSAGAEVSQTDLDSLRDEIAEVKAQLRAVASAPVPRAVAEAQLKEQISLVGRDFRILDGLRTSRGGHILDLGPEFKLAFEMSPLRAFAALCPERVYELASRSLNSIYAQTKGLSEPERERQAQRLKDRLHVLECAEESTVRAMEAARLPVSRRADVLPEIALAADEELTQ